MVKRLISIPRSLPDAEFDRRAQAVLARVQPDLLPDHAAEFIAINVETGEFELSKSSRDAVDRFRERWPDQLAYLARVNGGPVFKFYGK